MVAIDLSTAVFFTDGSSLATGTPYGKYDAAAGGIVTNGGWPDFYFPDWVIDRTETYTVTATMSVAVAMWITALDTDDPASEYYDSWAALGITFGDIYNNGGVSGSTHTFTIGPADWVGVDPDRSTLMFETHVSGTLTSLTFEPYPGPTAPPTASYDDTILAKGPQIYWKLDDTDLTDVTDSSGNANHGVFSSFGTVEDDVHLGEPSIVPSDTAGSVRMLEADTIGGSGYISLISPSAAWQRKRGETTELTLMVPTQTINGGSEDSPWERFLDLTGTSGTWLTSMYLNYDDAAAPILYFEIYHDDTNTGEDYDYYFAPATLTPGEGHLVQFTVDPDNDVARVWVDGVEITDSQITSAAAANLSWVEDNPLASPLTLPENSSADYVSTANAQFSMSARRGVTFQNVAWWNTVLSEEDLAENYAAWVGEGSGLSYVEEVMADGPALFLKFDDSTDELAIDSAAGGHDFELIDYGPAYHEIFPGETSLVPGDPDGTAFSFGTVGSTNTYGFMNHPDTTPDWGDSLSETVEFTVMLPSGTPTTSGGQSHYLFNHTYYTDLTSQSLGFAFFTVGSESSLANAGYFWVNASWSLYEDVTFDLLEEFDVYGWGRTLSLDTPHLVQIVKNHETNVMNIYVDGTEVTLGTITSLELEIPTYYGLDPGSASPVELFYPEDPVLDTGYQVTWQIGGLAGVQLDDLSWYPEALSVERLEAHAAAWGASEPEEPPPPVYPSTKLTTRTVFAA